MIYLQLFYTFFKIGLFGFGGGYAMLSMIQGEVVTRSGWVSSQEWRGIGHCYLCCSPPLLHLDADH